MRLQGRSIEQYSQPNHLSEIHDMNQAELPEAVALPSLMAVFQSLSEYVFSLCTSKPFAFLNV
jgi:hypothetical protein